MRREYAAEVLKQVFPPQSVARNCIKRHLCHNWTRSIPLRTKQMFKIDENSTVLFIKELCLRAR